MTDTTLKRKFREALIARKAEGKKIVTRAYRGHESDGRECCCAVGAIVEAQYPKQDFEMEAAEQLSVPRAKIVSIESGFCGWNESNQPGAMKYPSLHAYGQKLAKEFLD